MMSAIRTDQIVCPQCGTRGNIKAREVKQKVGVSGGKGDGCGVHRRSVPLRDWPVAQAEGHRADLQELRCHLARCLARHHELDQR